MRRKNKGFTLMELMVAVAILIIALTALLSTFIYCILLNQSNSNLVVAAKDAQYVLEQIKGLTYGQIEGYIENFNQTNIPNNFPPSYGRNITFDPTPVIGAKLANITVKVTWDERQNQRDFSLNTKIVKTTTQQ